MISVYLATPYNRFYMSGFYMMYEGSNNIYVCMYALNIVCLIKTGSNLYDECFF